jgi:hypothetical protein
MIHIPRHAKQLKIISIASALCLGGLITSLAYAQSPTRQESEAAQIAGSKGFKKPAAPAPTAKPSGTALSPNAPGRPDVSNIQDPNQTGLTGVVLGMRIDSTISSLGLSRCGARIKQVMLALTDNRPAAYFFEPTARNASQGPLLITIESLSGDVPEAGSRYSILHINPDCSGFYTQTVSWPAPCADVARVAFPNFRFDRRIVANVTSYRAAPTLQLSALPTPSGCVTVKKEIFR